MSDETRHSALTVPAGVNGLPELGGPWVAKGTLVYDRPHVQCCGEGHVVAAAQTVEQARRIAAAVRETAGIPTEALESGVIAQALDMIAEAFADPGCDGEEGLSEGMNCISCRAVRLLRAAGRRP